MLVDRRTTWLRKKGKHDFEKTAKVVPMIRLDRGLKSLIVYASGAGMLRYICGRDRVGMMLLKVPSLVGG